VDCTLEDAQHRLLQNTVNYMRKIGHGRAVQRDTERRGADLGLDGVNAKLYALMGHFLGMLDELAIDSSTRNGTLHTVDNADRTANGRHA